MKLKYCLSLIFFSCFTKSFSQSFWDKTMIGIGAGGMKYMGDIRNPYTKLGVQGSLTYEYNDHINFRGQILLGSVGGSDKSTPAYGSVWTYSYDANGNLYANLNSQARPHPFNSKILEASFLAEYNLLSKNDGYKWSPYGFLGIGYFNYNAKYTYTNQNNQKEELIWLRNSKNFNIPFGGGINYYFKDNITFYGEGSFRYTPVDDIDGLINANISKSKDYYYSIMLGIKFRLGGNKSNNLSGKSSSGFRSKNNCPPVYL